METYETWVRLFEQLRYYSWIVDRFHISTRAYQWMTRRREYDFGWLEERLLRIGFRIFFCTRAPESFERARADRLRVTGKPDQYDDLNRFVVEQETLRGLLRTSILPVFEVDVSDGDLPRITGKIADILEETGGLYADYGSHF